MDVELRHLKALAAIADAGTVTAAAALLHMTQPALSRTLAQLEARVGVRLVDRSSRHLDLTPAGATLLGHGRAILAHLDAALADARAVDRPLRLGYTCAVLGQQTVPLLRSWRRGQPHAPLEVVRQDNSTAGLATGDTDVAVLRTVPADPRIRTEALYTEDRVAALPDDHPLAARARVRLAELTAGPALPLALWPDTGTASVELWPPAQRPHRTVEVRNVDEWLNLIATGGAFGVGAAGTAESHSHPGVRFVPIDDAPAATVYLARPAHPTHPRTEEFLAAVREVVSA
ncbi:LysR family transcriptional regulator [Streptomyces spectabilis]|uniref:DNA-binding transcriptional LysR family regulator n=1 Tax=Streptomyces spectabilis TaxID=68270 RepID=A0A5P2X3Z6_STRST|nr:LysR family transcriptional regulator [Streptomyces spectabilis]MBB5107459.1 DNA-binding transcriptional LysR family regulator [Streptomyces spectabilis]MCI3900147.1 LysR family transcriptional regulator [Streptomyces spectabilis]QEV57760.1 LysR family transcriptional regulator [Streptomyces spectabilis]GGV37769.1 LysR family transcriptional regulator [Streptomyces spectabilis]